MSTTTLTALRALAGAPVQYLDLVLRRWHLTQSRKALRKLDDHLLRDIGLTRAEAEAEASRPVWDAPLHWRG
jgi:uncharacterized protein YjiS (DUF1127 family)